MIVVSNRLEGDGLYELPGEVDGIWCVSMDCAAWSRAALDGRHFESLVVEVVYG